MSETYLSFAEQALHYFNRPHDEIRRAPLDSPAAWRGPELARGGDWITTVSPAQIAELDAALDAVRARNLPLGSIGRAEFPLPTLGAAAQRWAQEIQLGRGFVFLRGLPVSRWGDDGAAIGFWGLGQHLGRPGAQNPEGDLLGHVVDTGDDASNPFVRKYRTAGDIAYHCDLADAVGLLCLRASQRGGASRIVSSVSVYNELLRQCPELIERLYEPFLLDTRGEEGDGRPPYVPVPPCRYADGRLRTFYHSDYFRSVVRHAEVPPFSPLEQELLDRYEAIASSPELYLDMQFEPGDVQLISNHTVLHARTAYEDAPESGQRRHLLRLWLSLGLG